MAVEMADGEILDAETSAALEEFKAQGMEIAGEVKPEAPKEPEAPKAEPAKPAAEPVKETKQEEVKTEAPEAEKPKVEREVKAVPVRKFNELRHENQELKRQLAERAAAPTAPEPAKAPEITDAVKAIAEKHGIQDPTLLQDLATTIAQTVGRQAALPADVLEAVQQMKQTTQAQQEELAFGNDFNGVSKEFPQLADYKDQIKELAYTEGNEKIPLRALALQYMYDSGLMDKGRKTAEPSTGTGASRGAPAVVDFADVTDEQFVQMSDADQAKYIAWQIDQENKRAEG